jgi:hypothetical protein
MLEANEGMGGSFFRGDIFLGRDDPAPAVETVRADMMAKMRLAGDGIDGQSLGGQGVMGTAHASLGTGFSVLLDSHWFISWGWLIFSFQRRQDGEGILSSSRRGRLALFRDKGRDAPLMLGDRRNGKQNLVLDEVYRRHDIVFQQQGIEALGQQIGLVQGTDHAQLQLAGDAPRHDAQTTLATQAQFGFHLADDGGDPAFLREIQFETDFSLFARQDIRQTGHFRQGEGALEMASFFGQGQGVYQFGDSFEHNLKMIPGKPEFCQNLSINSLKSATRASSPHDPATAFRA